MQRLSGLSSLHPSRHPFLSLQRPPAGEVLLTGASWPQLHVVLTVGGEKAEVIRVTDSKEPEENEDEDDLWDDDEKRKKKKTRTVFSRSQVRVAGDGMERWQLTAAEVLYVVSLFW